MPTFIIDCPRCKAKVGAEQEGCVDRTYFDDDVGEPYGERIVIGKCPKCTLLLVGRGEQTAFKNFNAEHDAFSDVVRVHPDPPKVFTSHRIPRPLTQSLLEADRSLQAGANIAACVMLGRALALRDHVTNPQTVFQAMSEQLPDVHFTIQQQDVVSMVAAMIREQRHEGILEGLRLAGALNEPSKRPSNSQTDGYEPG